MLFITITVVAGVLMYLFVRRVVVMKPVGIQGVDEAIDQLIERQRLKSQRVESRKRREQARSSTLSEHTMEIIESLTATTCPVDEPQSSTPASTAMSMSSETASAAKKLQSPIEFDKTFDPKEAGMKEEMEGGEKKHHRHHHKRHHRHRSRAEEKEKERSEESEEGDEGKKSKGGHKRHRRHRSKDATASRPRLDVPLLVAGESLPGPDAVDVEMRSQEAVKTP